MRVLIGFLLGLTSCEAFTSSSSSTSSSLLNKLPSRSTCPCSVVVDGSVLADGAVAAASFCAGVLVQVPRIQALQRNVTETKAAAESEIAALQERLYALDLEYEQGTEALKESFDAMRVDQLRRQKRKQAQEFQFKLQSTVEQMNNDMERQLKQQRADLLAQQLSTNDKVDRQGEIMQLRLEQEQYKSRNAKLQALLVQAQEEIAELQNKDKNPFLAFFGMGGGNQQQQQQQQDEKTQLSS